MEEIMKTLQNIQHDLAQHKRDMKDMEENIKDAINNHIDQKFNQMETRTKQLEQKLEKQQEDIDYLDKQLRMKRVIFFGVPELEKNYEGLLSTILEIINTKMNVTCQRWEIETVYRLGKKDGKRIRPVIVSTTTTSRKILLLKHKRTLDNTGLYIKDDYSPAVLQKRQELQDELKRRRLEGEKVALRYDKIVKINYNEKSTSVVPPKVTESAPHSANKRFLSESPETESKGQTSDAREQSKQLPKKNKS
ncbi:uncharacterized protein LOC111362865 [Spodoptera litura]|uniref:Uncharacterized protein LOC111362865 n=1 Tax=Spodoptera litura TaxID=69820 RepID=A0A9J7EUA4_SPOLT|nr:uncharacterized protein LOC111362865 [Spodoptera litura]